MSWSKKSEKGKKTTPSSAATVLGPVWRAGTWQLAQPIAANSAPPEIVLRVCAFRGGGREERRVVVELHHGHGGIIGVAPRRVGDQQAQLPLGQFSLGKNGVVMPISLRKAFPEKVRTVPIWHFQPNRPTRG